MTWIRSLLVKFWHAFDLVGTREVPPAFSHPGRGPDALLGWCSDEELRAELAERSAVREREAQQREWDAIKDKVHEAMAREVEKMNVRG